MARLSRRVRPQSPVRMRQKSRPRSKYRSLRERFQSDMPHAWAEIMRRNVVKSYEKVQDKFELYPYGAADSVEEIESKSRDGFMAFTDGGFRGQGFSSCYSLYSSGYYTWLPKKAEKAVESMYWANHEYAVEEFKKEYPDIYDELNGEIDYHSLYSAGYGSEAERLDERVRDMAEEDTIMFEIGVFYYEPSNYRNDFKGEHSCYVFTAVNWESPYHRSKPQWEESKSEQFSFNDMRDLEPKLRKALAKVSKLF